MNDFKEDLTTLRLDRGAEPPARRWLRRLAGAAVVLGIAAGAWAWVSRPRPREVDVSTVRQRDAGVPAAVLNASGYVTARRRATVSSKITGRIAAVTVEEGMAVRAGDVLARLDDENARAALALSEAQLAAARRAVREAEVRLVEAQRTEQRRRQLVEAGALAQADLDQIATEVASLGARIDAGRAQVAVAERQVALQRTDLDNTVIRAPFDGIAISKDAQPGEMVSPVSAGGGFTRTGICTLVDMDSLEVEVDVNESYINRVQPRQRVAAVLDAYPEWQIPARVITTVPAADRQTATVLVRIALESTDARILPDMGIKVTFLREAASRSGPVALVPPSAVRTAGGEQFVFVVAGGQVERRVVRTGELDGDRLEVTAGLRAGERVVTAPDDTLATGASVEARAP